MSPRHYSEDDLTLYYYGEGRFSRRGLNVTRGWVPRGFRRKVDLHLEECPACAALYREISSTLSLVREPAAPERGDQYGLEVWQRIRHRLPEPEGPWLARWLRWDRVAFAGAMAALLLAAFVAGRTWRQPAPPAPYRPAQASVTGEGGQQRILLTSVADHLDQSARILSDIMNAPDHDNISSEQRWAEDLLTASRLYRQDAVEAGEQSVAGVLDELERSLLEIVHSPAHVSAADLDEIRRRIDAAALLFKVRVMSDELRQRGEASIRRSPSPLSRTTTS